MSSHTTMRHDIVRSFDEARECLNRFIAAPEALDAVARFAGTVAQCLRNGGKLLSCGNGGSLCDAMHWAEEWSGRFRGDRAPLAAIALSDPAHMSCTANDYGYDEVFARQVAALGAHGDVLLLLSTSGRSANLVRAADEGRRKGCTVVGLLGRGGGPLAPLCDIAIVAPGDTSDRIQELHIKIIHTVIEAVERELFPELYPA
jgi:D-sedoheptulose 7-phosphate isomerase